MRVCPAGTAWFDEPSADNVAHGPFRECSNMVIAIFTSDNTWWFLHAKF
jgi:hypothetical protein